VTTLEALIRDGLDVEALPPGTAVILHARYPLSEGHIDTLRDQVTTVARDLGVKIAVVSHDFDVLIVPEEYRTPVVGGPTVNGAPAEEEIRR
jgi:hypothetical protein